jgi:hypothetical protein
MYKVTITIWTETPSIEQANSHFEAMQDFAMDISDQEVPEHTVEGGRLARAVEDGNGVEVKLEEVEEE